MVHNELKEINLHNVYTAQWKLFSVNKMNLNRCVHGNLAENRGFVLLVYYESTHERPCKCVIQPVRQ